MKASELTNVRKYAIIFVLAFFGACIYKVTYLKEVFYTEIIEVLQITNWELGILSSAVGIASMVGYFFGGFLADRFSSKLLATIGSFGAAILTLIYMTFPSFEILMLIHIGTALCGTLIFWAAYIRIVRILGGSEGQGRYFGTSEGVRSLIGIILPFIALAIMENTVSKSLGIRMVLLYYAICYLISGFMFIFILKDLDSGENEQKSTINKKDYIDLFKTPGLWLVSILVFGTYCVFALQSYTTPYMSDVSKISSATVGSVAIFRQYGLGLLSMPIAGFIADKAIKSSAVTSIIGLVLLFLSALGIYLVPSGSTIFVILLVCSIGFFVSGVRGIYYATMNEANISKALSGTAAGIISTIGFSPDAFIFLQVGSWLDKYNPEQAYRMIFVYMMITIFIAICAAIAIIVLSKKKKNREE